MYDDKKRLPEYLYKYTRGCANNGYDENYIFIFCISRQMSIGVMNSPKKYVCLRTHVISLFCTSGNLNKISGNNNNNNTYDI